MFSGVNGAVFVTTCPVMFIELPAVYGTALIMLLASIVIQSHAVRASCLAVHAAFSAAVTNRLYVHCVMSSDVSCTLLK